MTPQQFIVKWKRANLSERSAAQQHFLDLCELLDQPKPAAVGTRTFSPQPGQLSVCPENDSGTFNVFRQEGHASSMTARAVF
jgi:hypothetical protein